MLLSKGSDTLSGARDPAVNKKDENPCPSGAQMIVSEKIYK